MTILDSKGVITHKQVNLTNHAYERFLMRVESNKSREEAKQWFSKALNNCTFITRQNNGQEVYVFKTYRIVIDKHLNVITVMTENESDFENIKDTDNDIVSFIISKLNKEVRPLIQQRNETQIKVYEKEISKIKVHNPNTKDNIQKSIDDLVNEISVINNKIDYVAKIAKKYHVEPSKVHRELT